LLTTFYQFAWMAEFINTCWRFSCCITSWLLRVFYQSLQEELRKKTLPGLLPGKPAKNRNLATALGAGGHCNHSNLCCSEIISFLFAILIYL